MLEAASPYGPGAGAHAVQFADILMPVSGPRTPSLICLIQSAGPYTEIFRAFEVQSSHTQETDWKRVQGMYALGVYLRGCGNLSSTTVALLAG